MDIFRTGGGAQPYSIAFGGAFINFTEAFFLYENSTKNQNLAPKHDQFYTKSYNFP